MIDETRRPGRFGARTRILAMVLIAAAASGCGRRGALEPPPDPNAVVKPDNDPTHPQVHHKPKPVAPPSDPFILDPLL